MAAHTIEFNALCSLSATTAHATWEMAARLLGERAKNFSGPHLIATVYPKIFAALSADHEVDPTTRAQFLTLLCASSHFDTPEVFKIVKRPATATQNSYRATEMFGEEFGLMNSSERSEKYITHVWDTYIEPAYQNILAASDLTPSLPIKNVR